MTFLSIFLSTSEVGSGLLVSTPIQRSSLTLGRRHPTESLLNEPPRSSIVDQRLATAEQLERVPAHRR